MDNKAAPTNVAPQPALRAANGTGAVSTISWWREVSRKQWIAFGAAYFAWVLDSFDFNVYLTELGAISKEFNVSTTKLVALITLTLLTRLLGGVIAGTLGDRYGRKWPLLISIVWIAVCDALTALAPNYATLAVLRMLFGFGMGAVWVSSATMAMENWPTRSRGIASGILQGGWAVGYFLAAWVSSVFAPIIGWRGVFIVAALPGLLALPIHFYLEESAPSGAAKPRHVPWREILSQPATLAMLAWGMAIMAFGFAEYYALTALYNKLAQELVGASFARYVILFSIGMLAGAPVFGWLVNRRSAKFAISLATVGALCALPLYVAWWPQPFNGWAFGVGALFAGFFGGGVSGVTPILLTSIFPAQIRARAVGTVYNVGAFVTAAIPLLTAWLTDGLGMYRGSAMALIASISLVLLAVSMWFRPRPIPES